MKGSVTGKVVDWANGETMDQMVDQFGPWDYIGGVLIQLPHFESIGINITVPLFSSELI